VTSFHTRIYTYLIPRYPPNFDRRKIIGFAGKLIRVQKKEFLPALEKTAGGKLYNLVVDSSATAQYIFKNKLLKRRITILPLDKLSVGRNVDPRKIQKAKSLVGGSNAEAAVNCVTVDDPQLDIVAKFLFGGIIVTNSNNMASSICYDRDIKTKTISNEGGVYDPSGSIAGGGDKNFLILKELEKLREIENQIEDINKEYYELQDRLKEMDSFQAKFQKLNGKKAQMTAMLEQLKDKLQNSEFGRQQADIDALEEEVKDMQAVHDEAKAEYDKVLKEAKEIETRMHNLEKNRDQENVLIICLLTDNF
jgi:structural maintenance of chromosome 2